MWNGGNGRRGKEMVSKRRRSCAPYFLYNNDVSDRWLTR